MNTYDLAHQLSRSIQSEEVYKVLFQKKQELDRNPSAKKIVQNFRQRQWEFEQKRMLGEDITHSDQKLMQELQNALSENSLAREFLQAEYQFGILFQDVQKVLAEAVQGILDLPTI